MKRLRAFRTALITLFVLLLSTTASAQAATVVWRWPAAPSDEMVITSIAYGAGRFTVSAGGALRTSTDGLAWSDVPVDGDYRSFKVFYTGKEFVAIGCGVRCDTILTSSDGLSWETRYQQTGRVSGFHELAYGNGRYVVSYDNAARTLSSADLAEWIESGPVPLLQALAFGRGLFVGADWEGAIVTSPDGVEWTEVFRPERPVLIHDLAYGGGLFVAVGETGDTGEPKRAVVLTSPDASHWTLQVLDEPERLQQVAYGNGLFVASGPDALALSAGGTDWETGPNLTGRALSGVAYGAGRFVAVGNTVDPVLTVDVCGTEFEDVPAGTPWCDAAEALPLEGTIKYSPRSFSAESPFTRAELVVLLVRTAGATPAPDQPVPFTDIAGHWAAEQGYLQAALGLGLISGFPDGTFRPDAPVTRAQMVRLAAALAGLEPGGEAPYLDVTGDAWFAGGVAAAHHSGLIGLHAPYSLWPEGADFGGDQPITRAEAAMVLGNLVKAQEAE